MMQHEIKINVNIAPSCVNVNTVLRTRDRCTSVAKGVVTPVREEMIELLGDELRQALLMIAIVTA